MRRGGFVVIVALLAVQMGAGPASAACTKSHHYTIGKGSMPSGETWKVTARVKNNGSCKEWLFGLDYSLGEFGGAGSATGIPAGGHVPPEYFLLSANELKNRDDSERVFYGYTGREGAKVVATLKNGTSFEVKPQFAPEGLRKQIDWLRSFRFFVYFRPSESEIDQVSVYTRGGRLIYRTKPFEGSFF